MRKNVRSAAVGAAATACGIVLLAACGSASVGNASNTTKASSGPVTLGVIGPLTGPAATYGIAEADGVQLAVDQFNAKGGVLGHPVQVQSRDSKADPSVATTAALQLVQSDHVDALFGPIVNTAALSVAKISDQLDVPVLGTLGATTPVVYPNGPDAAPYPWVYRVLVSSPVQVQALVQYGMAHGLKRWAIIYEDDAYGQPTVSDLQKALAAAGGQLVAQQAIAVTASDATAQALAVKAANPDVVLVWSIQAPASKAVSALAAVNEKAPIYSANAQVSPQFFQLAGPLANGIISTGLKAQSSSSPDVATFESAYKAKFHIDPTLWAFCSYDTAELYLKAVQAAGTASPVAIQSRLNKTSYKGITGTITFTKQQHDGITLGDIQVVRLDNGKAVPAQ